MARGTAGYGIASVTPPTDELTAGSGDSPSLTAVLGCTDISVDAHRLRGGGPLDLPAGWEQVLVPIGGTGSLAINERCAVPARGLARVPPDRGVTVTADSPTTLLVLRTPASGGAAESRTIDVTAVEYTIPETSAVATAHLTGPLGCGGLKVNARRLEPGQAVPLHTEGTQEELFVPLDTGGTMRLADKTVPTPRGTIIRVPPATPRGARNDTAAATEWLMFGAPPTGGPTDWDPGATIVEDTADPAIE